MKFMWRIVLPVTVILISLIQFTISVETNTSNSTSTNGIEATKNSNNSQNETENGENKLQTSTTDQQPSKTSANNNDGVLLKPVTWLCGMVVNTLEKTKNMVSNLYERPSTKTNEVVKN